MIFNSLQYFGFLLAFVLLYWQLGSKYRTKLLLAGSYYFYGSWDYRFLSLLILSTLTDFTVGILLEQSNDLTQRRRLVALSLILNLGVLAAFKYFGFFIESAGSLLAEVGLNPNDALLRFALPVGISFYTFQSMSYSIDVYRGHIAACRNLINFATYVAYFPQLVAGPIERANNLLPQIERTDADPPTSATVISGTTLIGLGLVKKVVIADQLAPLVDEVFTAPERFSPLQVLAGVIAFSIQIYGDFSGYTDIARGSSRLLGIELKRNFRRPYAATSITDFWRRWHISLSDWLRDYLYIPLGGNRASSILTYRNLLLTMLLGGLWHGAGWNFIVWGALHGVALAAHRIWTRADHGAGGARFLGAKRTATFAVVTGIWIFFRAPDFPAAVAVLAALVNPGGITVADDLVRVAVFGGLMLLLDKLREDEGPALNLTLQRSPVAVGSFAGALCVVIFIFSGTPAVPFIYFQF